MKEASAIQKLVDTWAMDEYNSIEVGTLVREADGWIGIVTKKNDFEKRNHQGCKGTINVKQIEKSLYKGSFFEEGKILEMVPAGNYRPVISRLYFSKISKSWESLCSYGYEEGVHAECNEKDCEIFFHCPIER